MLRLRGSRGAAGQGRWGAGASGGSGEGETVGEGAGGLRRAGERGIGRWREGEIGGSGDEIIGRMGDCKFFKWSTGDIVKSSVLIQSATTGKAGGLKDVNRSKRLGNLPPPEGGDYSWNMVSWSRRLSSSRCFWMYSRMLASSRPTVET